MTDPSTPQADEKAPRQWQDAPNWSDEERRVAAGEYYRRQFEQQADQTGALQTTEPVVPSGRPA